MTREKFNETGFGPGMRATYKGGEYPIVAVAFDEGLVALDGVVDGADEYHWARCEGIEIVPNDRTELRHDERNKT